MDPPTPYPGYASAPLQAGPLDSAALLLVNSTMASISSGHSSHPNFGHLTLLVFEAVLEVVCVSLPGYIVARSGNFDGESQKFVAGLNINLFTPCLIFSKLAGQLKPSQFADLVIIPFIILVQTLISWGCAALACRILKLKKKPQINFVTAMTVFGNSNSLPLSLVISLSKTISGLHWYKIPNDSDSEVASRGILYLLVFSQCGQALRWSWGMNSLLKPLDTYMPEERTGELEMPVDEPYRDDPDDATSSSPIVPPLSQEFSNEFDQNDPFASPMLANGAKPANGHRRPSGGIDYSRSWPRRLSRTLSHHAILTSEQVSLKAHNTFESFSERTQQRLRKIGHWLHMVYDRIADCLNPPLVAILLSVMVATIPGLQPLLFTKGTFINNSVTSAITQSGGVAVPLILVVLGANLAKNTLPDDEDEDPQYLKEEKKMLYASLICRMLLTMAFMAPTLALIAKYVPISILGDPIFIIVCFLLAGAPSALQLAQMCQVNGVFVGAVSRLLFHSYVVWILPSTLILVVLALEVVEWAAA